MDLTSLLCQTRAARGFDRIVFNSRRTAKITFYKKSVLGVVVGGADATISFSGFLVV